MISVERKLEPALLLTPGAFILALAFVLPILLTLAYAFFRGGDISASSLDLTVWGRLFEDDYHLNIAVRTLRIGLAVTCLTLLIGYPLALIIEGSPERLKGWLLLALILPMMTSVVVRTFGWLVILGRNGPLAKALRQEGLVSNIFQLTYTEVGLIIAMTQVMLPYMVLVLIGVLGRIDLRLIEAARAMGARWTSVLYRVVIPLSIPGVAAGCILVFAISISSFITPAIIGGVKLPVLASGIFHSAIAHNDWSLAAAQATVLFILISSILLPFTRQMQRASA